MSNKQRFEGLLTNPNVRKALDIIAASEKANYNSTFGSGTFNDFSKHPNIQKKFRQKNGKINSSGAAGRYQFMKKTWNELQSTYGLDDFSPRNQDIGAIALLNRIKGRDGKTALQSAIEGDFQGMVEKSGNIWASFPSAPAKYSQPKHGWNKMNKIIATATGTPLPATGTPLPEVGDQQSVQQDYTPRYNNGMQNPVSSITNDEGYQQLQAELFSFNDNQQQQQQQQQQYEQPASPQQVATVQQTGFIDIPEVYNQAIENAFGEGNSQELFSKEIDDALRGVFDVA